MLHMPSCTVCVAGLGDVADWLALLQVGEPAHTEVDFDSLCSVPLVYVNETCHEDRCSMACCNRSQNVAGYCVDRANSARQWMYVWTKAIFYRLGQWNHLVAGLLIALLLQLHAASRILLMLLGQQCCAMPPRGHTMIDQRQLSCSLSFLLL